MPTSMMLRWRSAGRAPWRCGGSCRSLCWRKLANSTLPPLNRSGDEAWPDVRDADELHDVLHSLIALPLEAVNEPRLAEVSFRTAGRPQSSGCAIKRRTSITGFPPSGLKLSLCFFPDAHLRSPPRKSKTTPLSVEDATLALVTGWMAHSGPCTASTTQPVDGTSGL